MHSLLLPILYRCVDLKTNEQCNVTLKFLVRRRDIARHIRKLIVRPNYLAWMKPDKPLDESRVTDLIEGTAVNLHAMHTFVWDGQEIPDDHMWLTLRKLYALPITISSP